MHLFNQPYLNYCHHSKILVVLIQKLKYTRHFDYKTDKLKKLKLEEAWTNLRLTEKFEFLLIENRRKWADDKQ